MKFCKIIVFEKDRDVKYHTTCTYHKQGNYVDAWDDGLIEIYVIGDKYYYRTDFSIGDLPNTWSIGTMQESDIKYCNEQMEQYKMLKKLDNL